MSEVERLTSSTNRASVSGFFCSSSSLLKLAFATNKSVSAQMDEVSQTAKPYLTIALKLDA